MRRCSPAPTMLHEDVDKDGPVVLLDHTVDCCSIGTRGKLCRIEACRSTGRLLLGFARLRLLES